MSASNPFRKLSSPLSNHSPHVANGRDHADANPSDLDPHDPEDDTIEQECNCPYAGNPLRESMLRLLNSPAPPREDPEDIEIDPPPAIDPQKIADIPNLRSLEEAVPLFKDINRNIELLEGIGELTWRAQKLESLKKANEAQRCEHLKLDGDRCGSPALRGRDYCFFHDQIYMQFDALPVIEDQRSLQVAYLRLAQQVHASTISLGQAKLLLQILQSAGKNLPMKEPA